MIRHAMLILCCVIAGALAAGEMVATRSARATWHANPEADVIAYELRAMGPAPLATRSVTTADTEAVIDGLLPGLSYRFDLVAINSSGMRSAPSPETVYQVPDGWGEDDPPPKEDVTDPMTEVLYPRVRIRLMSSRDITRANAREEAIIYSPALDPSRFWWAEIEKP